MALVLFIHYLFNIKYYLFISLISIHLHITYGCFNIKQAQCWDTVEKTIWCGKLKTLILWPLTGSPCWPLL